MKQPLQRRVTTVFPHLLGSPGKSWNLKSVLESLGKSWDLLIFMKNPGKVLEFYTIFVR